MKIEIEDYKGHTIYYDEYDDKFVCDISIEDRSKSAKRGSLKDLRKEIDQFIKLNLDFKPFKVFKTSYGDGFNTLEITAIRTDGRLVGSNSFSKNSFYGKREAADFRKYDPAIEKRKEELDAELEAKKKEIQELYNRLQPIDLSKYELL